MQLPPQALSRSTTSLVGNRLLAALALGIAAAAVVPFATAAVVTINLTDTRNDGSTTTDDTIAGVNGGLLAGAGKTVTDWLGANTGNLTLFNGNQPLVITPYFWGPALPTSGRISYGTGGILNLFSGGDVIDSSDFGNSPTSSSYFRADSSGPSNLYTLPAFGPNTYLGFRFGSGPSYNYGYLGVTWDGSSNFEITSGAYESTANQSITIPGGAGSSVPDSSSTGLMGLVFAGAAVRQWRKTRR